MSVLEVRRDDLASARLIEESSAVLTDGEALLAVEHFGLTANVVTYATVGDALGYWRFFPAAEAGWGRIPAWGFAEVVASAAEALAEGERLFGLVPMASHMVLVPEERHGAVVDAAPHRATLPGAYNVYRRVRDHAEDDARELVLRPLLHLCFLLADQLRAERCSGADQVLLTSASSKTALGLAHQLAGAGVRIAGLTSARNATFVRDVGIYDEVVTYDELERLDPAVATGAVDMAGDPVLRGRVHEHFADALRQSVLVGATHGRPDPFAAGNGLPGPVPAFFLVPERLRVRSRVWGHAALEARTEAALAELEAWSEGWLSVEHATGPDEALAAYRAVQAGEARPDVARVASL